MRLARILHVVWTLKPAGAERVAQAILSSSLAAGLEPLVCALSPSEETWRVDWERKGIQVFEAFKRPGIDPILPFRLRKILRGQGISILHTHNAVGGFYGGLAAGRNVNHVHTEHSNLPTEKRFLRWQTRRQLRSAIVVADSQKVAVTLERRDGFPKDRIRLIYNGVALSAAAQVDPGAIKGSLGISPGARVVGNIGNLRFVKDHSTLLRGFQAVQSAYSDLYLVIVGEGEERQRIEGEARQLSLQDRLRFAGYRKDVAEVLQVFDLFVLSSKSEGLPLALLEAMAAGCPCISTAVGGVPEVIQDGWNGLLVPPETPAGLARAMEKLLSKPDRARQMGERGFATVRERFSEERMVREYLELYREML